MSRTPGARVLGSADLADVRAVLARDPVADVFVASRVEVAGVDSWRLGGELWGFGDPGRLESLCYAGANLVPVQASGAAARAFAERARRAGRRCSSLVGEAGAVREMWRLLESRWGPARDVRPVQPLLVLDDEPLVASDPRVELVRPEQLDLLLPACVAMFTEEVGVSPLLGDGGALYRTRVAELIGQNRAFARIEGGRVLFKAEVGAATAEACQVQGVWVRPELRGRGIGTAGIARVAELARAQIAPVVSLYVNDYNAPARRSYVKAGFRRVGTFASVLF